jgi:hypothetical protein
MIPKAYGQLATRPKNRNSTVNIPNCEKHAAENSDYAARLSNVGLYFRSLLNEVIYRFFVATCNKKFSDINQLDADYTMDGVIK